MKKLFVDIHVIQSVPPSCLNRDDTGSPKTAIYGGVRRARVSSQAWKRAMRNTFKDNFNADELSYRTRSVFDIIADEIIKLDPSINHEDAFKKTTETIKIKEKDGKAAALFFISNKQAKNVAAAILNGGNVKSALKSSNGIEIALFGRMVADDADLNCDACSQVAHAISTHRTDTEYDYFTAVDDLAKETQDHAGGAHLGTIEFNSSTLYRYGTVAAHNLYKELNGETDALEKAITEFVRAFISSMPSGKQNTFAAFTPPSAVYVALRADTPVNLAGAFEKAVKAGGEGFSSSSIRRLNEYAQSVYADFVSEPSVSFIIGVGLEELGDRVSLEQLLERIGKEVSGRID